MLRFKVLVVEDDQELQNYWKGCTDNRVIIIGALSIEEARQKFQENPDISAIAVDACVPGNKPTTEALVKELRMVFPGPMIAISSLAGYRKMLMKAGCDHESQKRTLPQKFLEVLKI